MNSMTLQKNVFLKTSFVVAHCGRGHSQDGRGSADVSINPSMLVIREQQCTQGMRDMFAWTSTIFLNWQLVLLFLISISYS